MKRTGSPGGEARIEAQRLRAQALAIREEARRVRNLCQATVLERKAQAEISRSQVRDNGTDFLSGRK